jgi:hypothetical protein
VVTLPPLLANLRGLAGPQNLFVAVWRRCHAAHFGIQA